MTGVFFLPLAESAGKSHSRHMVCRKHVTVFWALGVAFLLPACSYFETQKAPPPAPAAIIKAPVIIAPKPAPKPARAPEKPFAVMGMVLGDACPSKGDANAAFASCRNGRVIGIGVSIPAFDKMAKDAVFARALAKFGAPDEDRHGGLPMSIKIMEPAWTVMKTQPDLQPYHGRRAAFWWVDEVAKHFVSVEERAEAVEVRVVLADPKARLDFDKQDAARQKLEARGRDLLEKF